MYMVESDASYEKEARQLIRKTNSIVKICGSGSNVDWHKKDIPTINLKEENKNHTLKIIYNAVIKICYSGFNEKFNKTLFLDFIIKEYSHFDYVISLFTDAQSLRIFDWYIQIRIGLEAFNVTKIDFGNPRMLAVLHLFPGPHDPAGYIKAFEEARKMPDSSFPGELVVDRLGTWIFKQYEIAGFCEAESGDYVLDCGAFTGNTAMYFADKIGEKGRCYSFEGLPAVFDRFNENMKKFSQDENVIKCIFTVVSDYIGTARITNSDDPCLSGASLGEEGIEVPCTTIDNFVESNTLPRVDFIKMDIEGGEMGALLGARETIRKYRPKLAISVYHKYEDLITIPEFIQSLGPYVIRLKHNAILTSETILFAVPKKTE